MEPLEVTLERLQTIPRGNAKVAKLGGIVQIEELSAGNAKEFIGENASSLGRPIVIEVFRELVAETQNHLIELSYTDNSASSGFPHTGDPPTSFPKHFDGY